MLDMKNQMTPSERYETLCQEKKRLNPKNLTNDALDLIKAIGEELLSEFNSDFLNACFTVWSRRAKSNGIKDCTYVPRSFCLQPLENLCAVTAFDAYYICQFLADVLEDKDINETVDKWTNSYLGKYNIMPSNPADNRMDKHLLRIDNALIQKHHEFRNICKTLEKGIYQNDRAQREIVAAKKLAREIEQKAEQKRKLMLEDIRKTEQQANKLRQDGELAANKMRSDAQKDIETLKNGVKQTLDSAQKEAQRLRDEAMAQAAVVRDAAKADAEKLLSDAQISADEIKKESDQRADEIIGLAMARANEIKQTALGEKYALAQDILKDGVEALRLQLSQMQREMRTLEDKFDDSQLLKIFMSYYSLYDLIDSCKGSLTILPKEYRYLSENMEEFLTVIQENLADFGIRTLISEPNSAFDGKYHEVQNARMFDPAKTRIAKSLRPGFINTATGNVLQKEKVAIHLT